MATAGEIKVKVTTDVSELLYAIATAEAMLTRWERDAWPTLPFYRRWWRTLLRQGW